MCCRADKKALKNLLKESQYNNRRKYIDCWKVLNSDGTPSIAGGKRYEGGWNYAKTRNRTRKLSRVYSEAIPTGIHVYLTYPLYVNSGKIVPCKVLKKDIYAVENQKEWGYNYSLITLRQWDTGQGRHAVVNKVFFTKADLKRCLK